MSNSHTISLNGRNYDALTGKIVDEPSADQSTPTKSKSANQQVRKTMDGIIRIGKQNKSPNNIKSNYKQVKKKSVHKVAPHIARATEHSKTLMRQSVSKPTYAKIKTKKQVTQKHVGFAVTHGSKVTAPIKKSVLEHANVIKKSDLVVKFSELAKPANPIQVDPTIPQTTANSEVHLKNLDRLANIEAGPNTEDAFTEAALRLSDSHAPKKHRDLRFYERWADSFSISVHALFYITSVIAILIIIGITGYIFKNNVEIYLANYETGMSAVIPSYQPPGFTLSSIKYSKSAGEADINLFYKSNSDSRNYDLEQQPTTWDNNALLSSVVNPIVGSKYTSSEIGGRTVYSYGANSVWVSANKYYKLTNQADLTKNQISQIVTGS